MPFGITFPGARLEDRRILCDIGGAHPAGGTELAAQVLQLGVGSRDEFVRGFGRDIGRDARVGRLRTGRYDGEQQ